MSYLFQAYSRWNIHIKQAKGTIAVDENGKTYLDFVQGIAVCNLGHCPDPVAAAIKKQLDDVWHVSNLFQNGLQETVAQKLANNSAGDLVFFCNSGAEANEAAIKLARKHTQKTKIITFQQSFHGRTYAGMAATGQEKIKHGFGPMLTGFHYLPYNEPDAFNELSDEEDIAAVMLETIQGEGGVIPASGEFLQEVQAFCRKKQALLIIDEVQTGIGRTGKAFGYQHEGLSPDIITVAKGLGSGFPVGAVIGKQDLSAAFSPGSHGTTFGGNMLAMAAANATLDIIFEKRFLDEVSEKGECLREELQSMLQFPLVKEIRGKGLIAGIECKKPVQPLIEELQTEGLLVLPAGPNVIRLLPPLTVEKHEITEAVEKLNNVFSRHSTVKQ
ncbi:acetylornithine transaminase [Bacillus sonorensis]|uniref:Acetylornithine aminotransferase n=2 Tax=Bacillus sonorensis TaxID=119858 RepID=M5PF35_9BACI|nr:MULTISPECIES: acetylornithine transaminase [Bacillus]TWK72834.1 Acetylornithine aminotransferase [Bacillus paralicheniformis]ASB90139.1 Acetylornithine transaminase [Bacillus sonorensis]EME76090.1 acetylornithine aminotransferase [Bacillus sonorensis L12]MBG9916661.1 acetylornithine aminotransferase [Bacillus sonorensis]MCY7855741.1 acetylornithine transaminase [Bacillus sonorensis]